jgi:hypothetical protein
MTVVSLDPEKWKCLLAYTSDRFYAGLVTQIHE